MACGGIAGRVLKCIAIDPQLRGQGLALTLMTTLINQALRDAAQGVTLAEVVRQTIRQELHHG